MEDNTRMPLLEFLPVSIFGAVMGLSGLAFAWRLANKLWHWHTSISEFIGGIAILLFLVLLITFVVKFRRYPALLAKEFAHPVSVSFYRFAGVTYLAFLKNNSDLTFAISVRQSLRQLNQRFCNGS